MQKIISEMRLKKVIKQNYLRDELTRIHFEDSIEKVSNMDM